MKLFFTGPVGVGKTTLLQEAISILYPDAFCYGFQTKKLLDQPSVPDIGKVLIFPISVEYSPNLPSIPHHIECVANLHGPTFEIFPDVFDSYGVQLLSGIPKNQLVIMDEIGFLESSAHEFSSVILKTLDKYEHILGVIKPMSTPLLDAIRKRSDIHLLQVSLDNRDQLRSELYDLRKNI